MSAQLAFSDVTGGASTLEAPNRILPNQVARMVNCAIIDGYPHTRPRVRAIPLTGDVETFVRENNVQGSIAYNPALGQGGLTFGQDQTMIVLATGGRKIIARIIGTGAAARAELEDITNDLFSDANLHLAWLAQWENYLLAQDGRGNCFIWDSVNPAFHSAGYSTTDKPSSRVPNGGTVMVYSHGRGSVVVNSRYVLTGDIIHQSDLSSAANVLNFIDQVYWATGRFFMPTTEMGPITAAAVLPLRNTQHGHGETIFHCERGIFSIDLNIFPRDKWSETQMTRTVLSGEGAVGPYALDAYNGDQVFRSAVGVKTLRSAAATNLEGDTNEPISSEVGIWTRGDYEPYLRFCSLSSWAAARRLFCTVNPIVQGRHRWHRGMIVRSYDTTPGTQGGNAAWEGLWTLPPEMAGITQFVNAFINRSDRMFAWTRGADAVVRLVEFTQESGNDVLEDGSERAIRAQVITRMIDAGQWWTQREYTMGRLYLRKISGAVRWKVWVRSFEGGDWHVWASGAVDAPVLDLENFDLTEGELRPLMIPLGSVPKACTGASPTTGLQMLVRWEGCCGFQGIRVTHGDKDLFGDDPSQTPTITLARITDTVTTDFEYSENILPDWL